MKRYVVWISVVLVMLCGSAITAHAQMVVVGDYTNMRYTQGECLGYDLMLWKTDGQLFGVLSYCAGLSGDTPIGYIDHVVWDAKTGKLTFDAKLTIGSHGEGKDGKELVSKDFYQFDGVLTANSLSGKMTDTDMYYTPPQPSMEAVKLKLDKADTKSMTMYPTREDWLAFYADIMAAHGPKW